MSHMISCRLSPIGHSGLIYVNIEFRNNYYNYENIVLWSNTF